MWREWKVEEVSGLYRILVLSEESREEYEEVHFSHFSNIDWSMLSDQRIDAVIFKQVWLRKRYQFISKGVIHSIHSPLEAFGLSGTIIDNKTGKKFSV